MIAIGLDPKIVCIIESLYNETECVVVIDGRLTEWFAVKISLRQGYLQSPIHDRIQYIPNIFLKIVNLPDLTGTI